jgi:hypothetical protein
MRKSENLFRTLVLCVFSYHRVQESADEVVGGKRHARGGILVLTFAGARCCLLEVVCCGRGWGGGRGG